MRAALILLLAAGCSTGHSAIYSDGPGGGERMGFADGGRDSSTDGAALNDQGRDTLPPVSTITCNNDCRDYVVSRLVLPTPASAGSVGIDHDGDGKIDNALATILGTVASLTSSLDPQKDLDEALYRGKALILIRVQAADFTSSAQALAQIWRAAEQTCCTSSDLALCKAEAMMGCLDGSHAFAPHATTPNTAVLGGPISAGAARFGPATVTLSLTLSGVGALDLALQNVHLLGTPGAAGIADGVLAGAIPKSEVDGKLLPALAAMLNDLLADPTESPSNKTLVLGLFDVDKDGKISVSEIKSSYLVTTLLGGDVDFDKDGVKETSLGLSFEAVTAVIQ